MTFIEQRVNYLVSYGSKFHRQSAMEDLDLVKSDDYITVWFDKAVFPQCITMYETYDPGNVAIVRVWGQTWEKGWILLWEDRPDREMYAKGKFNPPIRQVQKLMRVFRIDLSHNLLQCRASFNAVVLSGYKPKFMRQENPDNDRRLGKFQSFQWQFNELWMARRLHSRKCKDALPERSLSKISKQEQHCSKDNCKLLPKLPNEIMLKIFNYLDIKSWCRCAQVNKHWLLISEDPSLYYELNLKRYWHKVNNSVLQHFMNICKSLKKLDLSWCGREGLIIEEIFIEFLQTCCQNLTHLSLGYCDFVKNLALEEIGKCSALTDLRLRNCESQHYFPLAQLHRLTILDLDCSLITDKELIAVLSANPHLEHLILDFCENLQNLDNVMETIAVYNSKLITWSSWGCKTASLPSVAIGHLAKCPELRELDIGWCVIRNDPGDCFERISHGCKNLERLVLAGSSPMWITINHLLPIIKSCEKLIRLDLGSVDGISKDFCEMILASLPNLKYLDLHIGRFKNKQIAEWSKRYPNVVIQSQEYGPLVIPRCVRPNSQKHADVRGGIAAYPTCGPDGIRSNLYAVGV